MQQLKEISERIRALREIMELSVDDMAKATDTTPEQYSRLESGMEDFSFTFLYKCAKTFGVDMIEILTGENPHLMGYTVVRAGEGIPIKRRRSFKYEHLAPTFKDKIAEPFLVTAPYIEEEQNAPIALSTHEGQEFDYIISGSIKFAYGDHTEVLNAGDSVYYDSGTGHGMIAVGGREAVFISVVMRPC